MTRQGTVRLRVVPVAEVRAMVAGAATGAADGPLWHPDYPLADTVDGWTMMLGAHEAMGTLASALRRGEIPAWWVHQIVLDDVVVGDIGFHGPPAPDADPVVEIGYNVVPAARRRGVATRAGALVLEQAWRAGAVVVTARTEPDNLASQRVLTRNGFRAGADGVFRLGRPA